VNEKKEFKIMIFVAGKTLTVIPCVFLFKLSECISTRGYNEFPISAI
jgi:hypothetical protein